MTDDPAMTTPSEFVAYHPPKSVSHGHGSRARNARRAWAATEEFIFKHTQANLSPTLRVKVWGPSEYTDATVFERAIEEGIVAFGSSPTVSGIFSVWELTNANLPQALEFAFKDEERPKQQLGPVDLYVSYSFEWKSLPPVPRGPDSSHFARGCRIGVSIGSRRCFIQPTFLFSLPSSSPELIHFLSELEPDLPFVPKDEYFCRVVPKKSDGGEKLVKLHRGWRSAT
ncbi:MULTISPECIES: hypothetical protein [unclassified Rubrivivax]|uniref:hypothetical protein n=1 Tax=unclassified Rubrivivax TaxID=2649762 RepID=UPI001E2D60AB|nr:MULTISPECIES: hypothetical protein [unclassified Rubrivivax]MCC9598886.1 hypothetical protein [Rubrivivax sp. JA1055]MCC9648586.1 hypothetical protein [Rubrivivax sp. JA1029]